MESNPNARHPLGWLADAVLLAVLLPACSLPDIPIPVPAVPPEVVDPPCLTIPAAAGMLGYRHQIPDGAVWVSGCYNPANANEVAAVGDLPDPAATAPGLSLYRLNLATGQRTLLYDGLIDSNAEWSRTGWIAFLRGGEAWKIKANGDSLQQVTNTGRRLTAVESWSPDGRQLLCYRQLPDYTQTGLAIYTAQGTFMRLLPDAATRAYGGISWSPDGQRLAYAGGPLSPVTAPRLCLYDLATNRIDTLDVLPRTFAGLSGVRWLPSGQEIVWGAINGIGITNLQTRRTRLLRTNCQARSTGAVISYGLAYPRPSPDGQRILVARGDRSVAPSDPGLLLERYSLETMSVQGGQLRKITP